jgi:anti-sigma factor RsiW
MFASHVSKNLSAYCHGELSETESRQVAEHLIGCRRCQMELGQIKLGIGLAERLPIAQAPESMWSEIQNEQVDVRLQAGVSRGLAGWSGRKLSWQTLVPVSAAVIIAAAIAFVTFFNKTARTDAQLVQVERPIQLVAPQQPKQINPPANPDVAVKSVPGVVKPAGPQPGAARPSANGPFIPPSKTTSNSAPSWEVARLEGTPKVGSNVIGGSSRLSVGESLETDGSSRAKINVADIGEVDIGPNSRVRLIETRATKHVLALDRGRMHAVIDAPPRLFFVETPSAVAVDLGCAYTLEVDDAGRSVLQVTSGWVALELKGRDSIVPAGASCVTEPGKGLGTPYFDDASAGFRAALHRYDFENGGGPALAAVLAEARERDTLTLWHLLVGTRADERGLVFDRVAALVPPPAGVTRAGVLRADKRMLSEWKVELEYRWFDEAAPGKSDGSRKGAKKRNTKGAKG